MSKSATKPAETHCLNCGKMLFGKFCSNCGQKANIQKDSFWHMAIHFVGHYFHYDGRFWTTLKTMFTRPGLVTLDYIEGKRARYLNPLQLYIFVVTLLVIFTLSNEEDTQAAKVVAPPAAVDSVSTKAIADSAITQKSDSSRFEFSIGLNTSGRGPFATIGSWTPKEKSLPEYDSMQQLLPEAERDGFMKRQVRRKYLSSLEVSPEVMEERFWKTFMQGVPKVLFILLPFFALLLKGFFGRKTLYYVDHIVFSLHFHSVLFLLFLMNSWATLINDGRAYTNALDMLTFLGIWLYLFLSLKRVYGGSLGWIIIIQVLMTFVYLIMFLIFMMILLFISYLIS